MQLEIQPQTQEYFLNRIRVELLFGYANYDLVSSDKKSLLIFYGDNGSGKTTLLRLILNLLTSASIAPERRFIFNTPFRAFEIDLGHGVRIVAERGELLSGSYRAVLHKRYDVVCSADFAVDEITDDLIITPEVAEFKSQVDELHINIFFLSDDRDLVSNYEFRRPMRASLLPRASVTQKGKPIDRALSRATNKVLDWTRDQIRSRLLRGEADANTIYADISKRLGQSEGTMAKGEDVAVKTRQLISSLDELIERNRKFLKLGLPGSGKIEELANALKLAQHNHGAINTIVDPYVESVKVKLDVLEELYSQLKTFVESLGQFYTDKHVTFDAKLGLRIVSNLSGEDLAPQQLSSGEKQLLLLFSNVLTAGEASNIFIIDEPELSLNIKWQQKLLSTLLIMTAKRQLQLVLATHSFELFAPFSESVVQLDEAGAHFRHGNSTS